MRSMAVSAKTNERHAERRQPWKILRILVVGLVALGAGAGCTLRAPCPCPSGLFSSGPQYALAVHALAGRAERDTRLERTLKHPDGRIVRVRSGPLLTSAAIPRLESREEADGSLSAVAHLDRHGELAWMQACASLRGGRTVVALDGQFHHFLPIPLVAQTDGTVNLGGPWEKGKLDNVIERAPKNYREMNRF